MTRAADRARGLGPSPFAEMTALAARHDAVNLGQGFPDFGPPEFLLEAARDALASGLHQYSPPPGLPRLREAVARSLEPALGFAPDPDTEVTVTLGATEAMLSTLLAVLDPGDGAIVVEPAYDAYGPQVRLAGGVPVAVRLERTPEGWRLDEASLRAAVTPRTRALLLNSPHNPTGAVLSRAELEGVARVAVERDLIVISDEVYDRLWFEREHLPAASLPGVRERTVTLGSAGKTFAATGWRVGWAVAPAELSRAIRGVHQFNPFCAPTPLQAAVASALDAAPGLGYYEELRGAYRERRDRLASALTAAGFEALPSPGAFFLMADYGRLSTEPDVDFCRRLVVEAGVAAIPPSIFLSDGPGLGTLARFAFCKDLATLDRAAERLATFASGVR